jgi:hypothetical protein
VVVAAIGDHPVGRWRGRPRLPATAPIPSTWAAVA